MDKKDLLWIGKHKFDEINEVIKIYGDNLLTMEIFDELDRRFKELEKLKKLNITNNNFTHKVKSYNKIKKKLKEEFDYNLPLTLPFNSPSEIKIYIHLLLNSIDLNKEQIQQVFKEYDSEIIRLPKLKNIDNDIYNEKSTPLNMKMWKKTNYVLCDETGEYISIEEWQKNNRTKISKEDAKLMGLEPS